MGGIHSVIIPTCNHPELLGRCLATLVRARPPSRDWEALVIDNSEERYRVDNAAVVASFRKPLFFRYEPMPAWGLMAARHEGVARSRGDVVSFIDDDSFVSETWLEGVERAFSDSAVLLSGGPIRPEYEQPPPAWADSLWSKTTQGRHCAYLSLQDFGDQPIRMDPTYVWGCNYSFRKDIFYRVKGSHPDYLPEPWKLCQGDGEVGLSVKIEALGHEANYEPLCAIRHWVPTSRMTAAYLGKRAFFVGIHSSFTAIRAEHGLKGENGVRPDRRRFVARMRRLLSRTWLGKVRRFVSPPKPADRQDSAEAVDLHDHLRARYTEGWTCHRTAVLRDAALLRYVLRPDFMGANARMP